MARTPSSRRLVTAVTPLLAALALAASTATPAAAALPALGRLGCSATDYGLPFARWGDLGTYSLAPNGALERGSEGWSLAGGAAVAAGNEPFYVHGLADASSLILPGGASATTPPVCITADHPVWRFFMRGPARRALIVQVLFRGADGRLRSPVVAALYGAGWAPPPQLPVVANRLLAPGQSTTVAFRFSSGRGLGNFRVDDVYVDPRHH